MRIPKTPPVGHVVAYEYLWRSQAHGNEDCEKVYPAAIILARKIWDPPRLHTPLASPTTPGTGRTGIVPLKLKRHSGLDDEPSWIYTDQVNICVWPGPALRPAEWLSILPSAADTCVISALPSDWFDVVAAHLAESYSLKKVKTVKRTA